MIKKYILQLIITIVFFSSCSVGKLINQPNSNKDNHIFWKISGHDLQAPSYLYGTFHMLCESDIVFSENVRQAMTKVDAAYFEIDMDDPTMSMKMLGNMAMKENKTLKDLFEPEAYQKLETYFKDSLKTALKSMEKYKPFMLVSMLYPKMMPCKKLAGVDERLVKLAKASKKTVEGLESVEFQISVFDSIPYEVQAAELLKAIDSMENSKAEMMKMIEAYKNKRLDILAKLTENDQMISGSMDVLLHQRNFNWVKELKEIMPVKSVFISVGAGHLPGDKGLLNLLRKEGYTLTAVE